MMGVCVLPWHQVIHAHPPPEKLKPRVPAAEAAASSALRVEVTSAVAAELQKQRDIAGSPALACCGTALSCCGWPAVGPHCCVWPELGGVERLHALMNLMA